MLYLSKPLGGGTGGAALQPHFGFRIDQVRMTGNSGAPDAGDPVQRRALIGWQFNGLSGERASGMRLELGGRVTYDMSHGGFQVQSRRPGAGPSRPVAKSFELRGLQFRNPDPLHDVAAAAIATFKSARNNPVQQRSRPSERQASTQESR
jgi:hypothetical protein